MMKKRYLVIPVALTLLAYVCLTGNELCAGFEKNRVYRTAREFISGLNRRQYDLCYSFFNDTMKSSMTEEKLASTLDSVLGSLGTFIRFKGFSASTKKILGRNYAICTVKCIYKNGPATFTVSLDEDLRIGSLYIK